MIVEAILGVVQELIMSFFPRMRRFKDTGIFDNISENEKNNDNNNLYSKASHIPNVNPQNNHTQGFMAYDFSNTSSGESSD